MMFSLFMIYIGRRNLGDSTHTERCVVFTKIKPIACTVFCLLRLLLCGIDLRRGDICSVLFWSFDVCLFSVYAAFVAILDINTILCILSRLDKNVFCSCLCMTKMEDSVKNLIPLKDYYTMAFHIVVAVIIAGALLLWPSCACVLDESLPVKNREDLPSFSAHLRAFFFYKMSERIVRPLAFFIDHFTHLFNTYAYVKLHYVNFQKRT